MLGSGADESYDDWCIHVKRNVKLSDQTWHQIHAHDYYRTLYSQYIKTFFLMSTLLILYNFSCFCYNNKSSNAPCFDIS